MGIINFIKKTFRIREYALIDIEVIKEQDKDYTENKDIFWNMVKKEQEKHNLTKEKATKLVHDSIAVKDIKSGKIKNPKKSIDDYIDDWIDDPMDFETGGMIYDVYE